MRQIFESVYTIEAQPKLFEAARRRFAQARNVTVLEGDSAQVLKRVLAELDQKAVFWLDAHWCGQETHGEVLSAAILGEMELIFSQAIKDHVIIIDDARYFCGHYGYPSVDSLRRWVAQRRPELTFDVALDSIRIHEPGTSQRAPSASVIALEL
jgi:hypothetical protein